MNRKLKFDLNVETNALLCPNPQEWYAKAYISEDIANSFRTLPGIKYKTKLATVEFNNILKASTCNFGTTDESLDAIDIDVTAISALGEICRFDLEQSFISQEMAKGSNGSFEVASFMSYYWDTMAKEIHAEIAEMRWKGDTAGATGTYLDLVDGYEKLFLADAAVIDVTAGTVTAANVLAEMAKVVAALPAKLQGRTKDLRFYVSSNVAMAYRIAAATGNTNTFVTEALPLSYIGIQIVVAEGMSANTMVLTLKDNLIYAFDGEGDTTALKAVNLEDSVAEPKLRTRANIKVGFAYVNPSEIVFYS